MKINIKAYEYKKIEIESIEFELPVSTSYYFETGVRRSIKITPIFTTWNKKIHNKDEELHELEIVCLYNSSECIAEKFKLRIKDIEKIYYSDKHKYKSFVDALVNGWFDERTKEQFDTDLKYILSEIQGI